MRLIPFDSFTLESKLSPDEVRQSIEDALDNTGVTLSIRDNKFSGYTLDGSFDITYKNEKGASVINIKGEVTDNTLGCIIKTKVKFGMLFGALFGILSFIAFMVFLEITPVIIQTHEVTILDIKMYGLMIVLYGLIVFTFNRNTRRAKRALADLVKASI